MMRWTLVSPRDGTRRLRGSHLEAQNAPVFVALRKGSGARPRRCSSARVMTIVLWTIKAHGMLSSKLLSIPLALPDADWRAELAPPGNRVDSKPPRHLRASPPPSLSTPSLHSRLSRHPPLPHLARDRRRNHRSTGPPFVCRCRPPSCLDCRCQPRFTILHKAPESALGGVTLHCTVVHRGGWRRTPWELLLRGVRAAHHTKPGRVGFLAIILARGFQGEWLRS